MDSILEEKQLLSNIRTIANYIVDTTQLTTKELKARVKEKFEDENFKSFSINVSSFGFKHGIQKDADLVFDVRFLQILIMLKT